jgi:hypothetical protein
MNFTLHFFDRDSMDFRGKHQLEEEGGVKKQRVTGTYEVRQGTAGTVDSPEVQKTTDPEYDTENSDPILSPNPIARIYGPLGPSKV